MRFFRFLIFITILKTKAQSKEIKDNYSGLFEFPKLEWPSPKTFIGYLSNFTHRVADIVNDVKLDSLSETEFFEILELNTDFELGNFTLTELEDFILNSIRNCSIYSPSPKIDTPKIDTFYENSRNFQISKFLQRL